jgi:hypothetical protein
VQQVTLNQFGETLVAATVGHRARLCLDLVTRIATAMLKEVQQNISVSFGMPRSPRLRCA